MYPRRWDKDMGPSVFSVALGGALIRWVNVLEPAFSPLSDVATLNYHIFAYPLVCFLFL